MADSEQHILQSEDPADVARAAQVERLAQLESRVNNVDVETQLGQAKALANLLTNMCETANEIKPVTVGWVGSLLDDTLARLELAIERTM